MDPLLKLLEEHALRSPADLAKMLNVSATEVARRIKQYEDDKVILGYKAVINDDNVDTDLVKAVIEVKIQPEREGGFDRIASRIAKFDEVADPHDHDKKTHVFAGYEQVVPGKLNERQYDDAVADLVAYLQWMGEPAQAQRFQLGVVVLIFLLFLTVFAWRLNASFWKNVK